MKELFILKQKINKILLVFILISVFSLDNFSQATELNDNRKAWWKEARFGALYCWGSYSVLGKGEQIMSRERIPINEYDKLADLFNPPVGCMDSLVRLVKDAGMKYVILVTRHHDGFCLFNTKTTDYNTVKSKVGRDLVDEFVNACRKYDIKVGIYYSIGNWRWPGSRKPDLPEEEYNKMIEEVHSQVKELMTNYGKIDILWYDGAWFIGKKGYSRSNMAEFWLSEKLNEMVRSLQPDILINKRSGIPEDFATPENIVTASSGKEWEACMTLGYKPGWGYVKNNATLKTSVKVVYNIVDAVRLGGNFLLNFGLKPDGTLVDEELQTLKDIGEWMRINGESIYGTELNQKVYNIDNSLKQN